MVSVFSEQLWKVINPTLEGKDGKERKRKKRKGGERGEEGKGGKEGEGLGRWLSG